MHVADFYATYCGLAGGSPEFCVADAPAAASGLPPVDSIDVWPLLSGATATSPRSEVAVDIVGNHLALIQGPYKFLTGNQLGAGWCGGQYPNASSVSGVNPYDQHLACGTAGCLYDVVADPTEQNNVAAAHPDIVSAMAARLAVLAPSFYSNNETGVDVPACDAKPQGMPCGCFMALTHWGLNFGPYQV